MATELAQAYVQIIPSAKGISGSIQSTLNPEAESAGTSSGGILGAGLVSKLKSIIVTAGIGKVIKNTITQGADLQQSIGGIETLFKGSFDKVKQYADDAYKTVGVSANQYMEQVTGFSASLLQSMGGDTDKAAEVANMAMIDMADNANKMGTDMDSIQYAYQGFAKQNYTMLDNLKLGYGGTKEEMARLLADAEKISGVHYDMSNLSDVYEAIHVIQGELDITGTTAKEASETFSGSFSAMKAAVSNLLGNWSIGENIGYSLEQLKTTVHTFLFENLIPMLGNIVMSLPTLVAGLATLGADLVQTVLQSITTKLPLVVEKGGETLVNFINGILINIPNLISSASKCINDYLNQISVLLPQILAKGSEVLLSLVHGIINNLPQIIVSAIQVLGSFIKTIGENMPIILQQGLKITGKLAAGLIGAIPDLVSKIPQIIKAIINTFKNVDWWKIGKDIIRGIANGLANAGHMLWDAVKGVLGNFKDKILSFFGIHSPSRWGIWVGNMINAGFGKGLENLLPINKAMSGLEDAITTPIIGRALLETDITPTTDSGTGTKIYNDSGLLMQITILVNMIQQLVMNSDKEIVIKCDNREVARALKEMGVSFA